jgi:chromosome partitioning protein
MVKLVQEAAVYTGTLQSRFVVNRKVVGTAIGRDVGETLVQYGLPVCTSQVCQRVTFAEALATGQTVQETAPHSPAAQEITVVVAEVLEGEH